MLALLRYRIPGAILGVGSVLSKLGTTIEVIFRPPDEDGNYCASNQTIWTDYTRCIYIAAKVFLDSSLIIVFVIVVNIKTSPARSTPVSQFTPQEE